jgi:prevent-host-death family protein
LLIGSQHQFCKGTWRSSSGRSTCSRPINTLIAISHNVAWLTNTSAV